MPFSPDTLTVALAGAGDPAALAAFSVRPPYRAGRRAVLTVAGDPGEARERILAAGLADDVRRDPLLHVGSPFGWTALSAGEPAPDWEPLPATLRRPVIALLDSGVHDHPWLPKPPADDPFLLHSHDPALAEPWRSPDPDPGDAHATFAAGLIRLGAPAARVLSVRVAGRDGWARESTVVSALDWLHRHRAAGHPVDVVCVSAGRTVGEEEDLGGLSDLEAAVRRLADGGARVVAPAGDEHRAEPVYPAAFKQVTAVGAGIGEYHARFTNHGDWVDRYREGIDLTGIVGPDGWARWSGTSLAAVTYASDLARPLVA